MKQGFDKIDVFTKALNIQAKLYCNVDNAYSKTQAIVCLKQLAKSWRMDDDYVILTLVGAVQSEIDARLRYMVEQVTDSLQFPMEKGEFRQRWDNMSQEEKMKLVDCITALVESQKAISNVGGMTNE